VKSSDCISWDVEEPGSRVPESVLFLVGDVLDAELSLSVLFRDGVGWDAVAGDRAGGGRESGLGDREEGRGDMLGRDRTRPLLVLITSSRALLGDATLFLGETMYTCRS